MPSVGKFNDLKILKRSAYGLFLDGQDLGEILLPKRFVPDEFSVGDSLSVFLYFDSEDRLVATTQKPYVTVGEFAYLKLKSVEGVGAFMDWGLDKDLFVHFTQQTRDLQPGSSHLVYVYLDDSGRLSASMRTNRFFTNMTEKDVPLDRRVNALVYAKTDLGYKCVIENKFEGLLYHSEVFQSLKLGSKIPVYVNKIRPDGKTDLIMKDSSDESIDEIAIQILEALAANKGFLNVNDKSSSETISKMFKVSRKKFKTALAGLYSKRMVKISEKGIELVKKLE